MATSAQRPAMRVRDVDPSTLLMNTRGGEATAPYVPRAVDSELDRRLAKPGIVVIRHEQASGARRTAYEALLRNLPDAVLCVGLDHVFSQDVDREQDVVTWLDGTWFADTDDPRPPFSRLVAWVQSGARRWLVGLVGETRITSSDWDRILDGLRPRVVRLSARLTQEEQESARAYFAVPTNVTTAAELINTVIPVPIPAWTLDPSLAPEPNSEPEPTTRVPGGQHIADYRADTDQGADRLGISADVSMLADLVTFRQVEPPLSIGLFGSWGAGKSFFMRQMRARVAVLADAARAAERQSGAGGRAVSSYCSSVRQITFNAWHYTETNLWAKHVARSRVCNPHEPCGT
jgi:hypothetical protein